MVTVVTVTLNAAPALGVTIASLQRQDRGAFEWIVVDGGSADATAELCAASGLDPAWFDLPGSSIYGAMNFGVRQARGGLVYFLNAGDALSEGFRFAEVLSLKRAHPRALLLYGNVHRLRTDSIYNGPFTRRKLVWKNICHQAIFFDTATLAERPYDLRYPANADYALNLALFGRAPERCIYFPATVAEYDDRAKSISRAGLDETFWRERPSLIRQYLGRRYAWLDSMRRWTHVRGMIRRLRRKAR